jgi:hypothetical protein
MRRVWLSALVLVVVLIAILSISEAKSSPLSPGAIILHRQWECRRAIVKLARAQSGARFSADWQTSTRGSVIVLRTSFTADQQGVVERMVGTCEFETHSFGERLVGVSSFIND